MAPKSPPVLVIAPGATLTPSHYAHLVYLLQSQGYGTLTSMLPSAGARTRVTAEDDAEYIRNRMLLPVLDVEKQDVILIMHSYSGMPGSAAARGLGQAARAAEGKTTAVIGQIFICTILPPGGDGKDVIQNLDGIWPPHISVYRDEDRMKCDEPREPLYHDVIGPEADAAARSAVSHGLTSFESPCPPCSWNTPDFAGRCAYVRAVNDQAIPAELQSMMLERSGIEWIVRDIEASHSPQLAAPEKLRDIILELVPRFTGEAGIVTGIVTGTVADASAVSPASPASPMESVAHDVQTPTTPAAPAPAGTQAPAQAFDKVDAGAPFASKSKPVGVGAGAGVGAATANGMTTSQVVSAPSNAAGSQWWMRRWRSLKHHLKV